MRKQLLIFFGKTGAGKNFVAGLFARELGYYVYDADTDLTPEMIYAIEHHLEFTVEMRARYFEIVKERIKDLLGAEEKIAVSQGLFKNKNRHDLMEEIPWAEWVWVDAEAEVIEERVSKRISPVTPEYARMINEYFEEPDFGCYKIINNGGVVEVLSQALLIEEDLSKKMKERDTNAAK